MRCAASGPMPPVHSTRRDEVRELSGELLAAAGMRGRHRRARGRVGRWAAVDELKALSEGSGRARAQGGDTLAERVSCTAWCACVARPSACGGGGDSAEDRATEGIQRSIVVCYRALRCCALATRVTPLTSGRTGTLSSAQVLTRTRSPTFAGSYDHSHTPERAQVLTPRRSVDAPDVLQVAAAPCALLSYDISTACDSAWELSISSSSL